MKEYSRIRFNPVTKEIEVEGSESFVKIYFNKLQAMLAGSPEKILKTKEKPIKIKSAKKKVEKKAKIAKVTPAKKIKKVQQKKADEKKVTNVDRVIGLIQSTTEGISIAELKEKTGLTGQQIAYVINRAAKKGKIRRMNRGRWCGGSERQDPKVE
jgi:predicted Rossmann fold nucleotide-binding protein DprA/Smf involved in DNA uptake